MQYAEKGNKILASFEEKVSVVRIVESDFVLIFLNRKTNPISLIRPGDDKTL